MGAARANRARGRLEHLANTGWARLRENKSRRGMGPVMRLRADATFEGNV